MSSIACLGEGGPVERKIQYEPYFGNSKLYVYILKSLVSNQRYIGKTENIEQRLKEHNSGKSSHTSKYKPWKISIAIYFDDSKKAEAFELYLKSGSGHAFAKRHF